MRLFFVLLSMMYIMSGWATRPGLPLSEVEGEPSTVVGGCVSVLTGNMSGYYSDVVMKGVDPLVFSRLYNSGDWRGGYLCDAWSHSYPHMSSVYDEKKWVYITSPEPSGASLVFKGNNKARHDRENTKFLPQNNTTFSLSDPLCEQGLTNTGNGEISGRTNHKNTLITFNTGGSIEAHLPDGGKRFFQYATVGHEKKLPCDFLLASERHANQSIVKYEYTDTNLKKLSTYSPGGTLLNWIEIDRIGSSQINIRTSEGRLLSYFMQAIPDKRGAISKTPSMRMTEVHRPDGPKETYIYYADNVEEKLAMRKLPDNRYLGINYYVAGNNAVWDEPAYCGTKKRSWLQGRVLSLTAPLGTDATPVLAYGFLYFSDTKHTCPGVTVAGFTQVLDAMRHRTDYYYCSNQRIAEILRYTGSKKDQYTPYSSDRFYWGAQDTNFRNDLVCRALLDGNGTPRSCRCLVYDNEHNVTTETHYGNLSGQSSIALTISPEGSVTSDCESYSIHYRYSGDSLRLKVSETEDNGRSTSYTYKPGSDLCLTQMTSDSGKVVLRKFFEYNSDNVLVRTVSDNGSGPLVTDLTNVTTRTITRVTPKTSLPGVGLPLVIEECYLDRDSGVEKLLHKKSYTYNNDLRVARVDYYDANDVLRYSNTFEYDAFGNVTRECDALGQQTVRRYDANSNKIFEQGPTDKFHTEYTYDFSNRLIKEEKVLSDGRRFTTAMRYDVLNQKVSEVDCHGNETLYTYNDLGQLILTQQPAISDAFGSVTTPTVLQEYDIAGHVTAVTDANGNTKKISYTMRGQTAEVIHPDGTSESSIYNLDGTLQKTIAANGLVTEYTYNSLGQQITKEGFSPEGQSLFKTSAVYHGTLLMSETDANGVTTSYTYDGAGRPICVSKGTARTTTGYDSLGRKELVQEWIDDTTPKTTRYEYDLLGRVLCERVEEASGTVLSHVRYTYDAVGNRITTTRFTAAGPATSTTEYDALQRATQITDALGYVTVIEYDHTYLNDLGQHVLQVRTTDALGNQTIVTHDALGHPVDHERRNILGAITAHYTLGYDAVGNQIRRTDTVYDESDSVRDVVTEWSYDSMKRVMTLHEALDSPESRITSYSYNVCGQQEALIAPDGLIISFTYDACGRLATYAASDRSLMYEYHYDKNNNVVEVRDLLSQTSTRRSYDGNNRLIAETLDHGLKMTYCHDGLGRPLQVMLPDGTGIRYTYDALNLRAVTRLDGQKVDLYTHAYTAIDQAGNVLSAALPGEAKELSNSYDLLSRPLTRVSHHYTERIDPSNYDPVGNLLGREVVDAIGKVSCLYEYDDLYQLTSEEGLARHRYRNDSLNNRLEKDGRDYTVNALNQLLQAGDVRYTYDKRGNMVQQSAPEEQTEFRYDGLGRLTEVLSKGDRTVYRYDSFNRRLSKTHYTTSLWGLWNRCSEVRYLYMGQNEIGAVDERGNIVELRLLGIGQGNSEIGATVAMELQKAVYVPISDSGGHITTLIDKRSGVVVESYRYSAFGEAEIYDSYGRLATTSAVGNPWRYAGKRVDPETGFTYFGRRYYHAGIGRWVTPDPLGFKAGPNLYAYVMNSPLTHHDLYGLRGRENYSSNYNYSSSYQPASQGNFFQNAARWMCSKIGSAIESVGRHGMLGDHLPRNFMIGAGKAMQGRPSAGCEYCREYNSGNYFIDGTSIRGHRFTAVQGVSNSLYDAGDFATAIGKYYGGVRVDYTYNATMGLVNDGWKSLGIKCGFDSPAVYRQAESWIRHINELGGPHSGGQIHHFCHSQGAQITLAAGRYLTPNQRKMIDITSLGGATMIPDDYFRGARNFVSEGDFVSKGACTIVGEYYANRPYNIIMLPRQPGSHFIDHAWSSPTYSGVLRRQGDAFVNDHREKY